MYRDSLYSNASTSSRMGGGSWVCINGELYHYGRPGMEWGKHLPGTDWWKKTVESYSAKSSPVKTLNGRNIGSQTPFTRRVGAQLRTAGTAVKEYGRMFNRASKYEVAKRAGSAYALNRLDARHKGIDLKSTNLSHLEKYMAKQIDAGRDLYNNLAFEDDSWKNLLNLSIRNAKYSVVKGVNDFLNKHGLADKVDRFISKFVGDSDKIKTNKNAVSEFKAQAKSTSRSKGMKEKIDFTQNYGAAKRNNYDYVPQPRTKSNRIQLTKKRVQRV